MKHLEPCPRYERAIEVLGKKWNCLIIRSMLSAPRRFSDISNYVEGLSDRLLSQRLQELEQSGIVERRVYDSKPVMVEYSLTEKGLGFRQVVEAIQRWADQWEANPMEEALARKYQPEGT
ncbi:HTH-type transcriptional regulator YodB [Geodia barretti]|uniref:HTH-type transcriptional regulator YodB n=1 Tax=Geodia barretti TaxID=519541 RepID=A0AA35SRW1_GEOBA|nr:HTH-type transcriptional regulator YodB [Geodia barretti]